MTLVVLAFAALMANDPAGPDNRYAVLVAADVGRGSDPVLHYAAADAQRMADTLIRIGGFDPSHVWVLRQPMARDVLRTLAQIRTMLATQADDPSEALLVVYYAGYSDPSGAYLGEERLRWPQWVAATRQTQAAHRLLIVDACRAGTTPGQSNNRLTATEHPEALGALSIFSSVSADEAAHESEAIGGALFTHHLLAALQGIGDANGDGRVSMTEALRYSAARAGQKQEPPLGGDVYATQRYRLGGRRDAFLTAPGAADSLATLHLAAPGTYVVRTDDVAGAVASQAVVDTAVRTLWLPAGRYFIERRVGRSAYAGLVRLVAAGGAMIDDQTLPQTSALLQPSPQAAAGRFDEPVLSVAVGAGVGAATPGQTTAPWLAQLLLSRRQSNLVFDVDFRAGQGRGVQQSLTRTASGAFGCRVVGTAGWLSLSAGMRVGAFVIDEQGGRTTSARAWAPHLDGIVRAEAALGNHTFLALEAGARAGLLRSAHFNGDRLAVFQPMGTMQFGFLF